MMLHLIFNERKQHKKNSLLMLLDEKNVFHYEEALKRKTFTEQLVRISFLHCVIKKILCTVIKKKTKNKHL